MIYDLGGGHTNVLAGMFVAGAGVAGATDSWDSFAGGLTGGLAGWAAGSGITTAYKEQFGNFRERHIDVVHNHLSLSML